MREHLGEDDKGRNNARAGHVPLLMAASQRDLNTIDRHIAEAEEEIRRQRGVVNDMRASGSSTIAEEAEQLLSKMIDALEEMKEHRRVIIESKG
jgi:hypothetical protein